MKYFRKHSKAKDPRKKKTKRRNARNQGTRDGEGGRANSQDPTVIIKGKVIL